MMRRYGLAAAGGGALTSNTIVLLRMSGRWLEAEQLCDEAEAAGLPHGHGAAHRAVAHRARDRHRPAGAGARHLDTPAISSPAQQSNTEVVADLHLAEADLALGHATFLRPFRVGRRGDRAARRQTPRLPCAPSSRPARRGRTRRPAPHRAARPRGAAAHRHAALAAETTRKANPSPRSARTRAPARANTPGPTRSRSRTRAAAAELWAALERPRGQAYCLFRQGEAELLLRPPGRRAVAARSGSPHGARTRRRPDPRRVESLAERARVPLDDVLGRAGESRPATHPQLTPREHQVLGELRAGRSNREIADKLYLSHRTVGVHVSNVLAKSTYGPGRKP